MIKKYLFFYFFILCINETIVSQSLQFSMISANEGLSQATVLCLLEDQNGFLWIGTADGLNKYNGSSFEVFRSKNDQKNCISDNEVMALLEDRRGNIWIGTGNGLTRLDYSNNKFDIFRHDPLDSLSLSNNYITSLYEDQDGNILIGTKFGLNRFEPVKQVITRIRVNEEKSLKRKFVKAIHGTSNGQCWIGFDDDLCLFDKKSNQLILPDSIFNTSISLKKEQQLLSILEDRSRVLWLGTNEGLYFFDSVKKELALILSTDKMVVLSLFQSKDGKIWIGSDKGLFYLNEGSKNIQNLKQQPGNLSDLSNNVIHSILEDQNGIFWVGTGSGLNKHDHYISQFNTTRVNEFKQNDYISNKIWVIEKTKDNKLWIGSEGGLFSLNDQLTHKSYKRIKAVLPGVSVNSIAKQENGNLWLGTYGDGLIYFNRKNNKFKKINHKFNASNSRNSEVIKTLLLSKDEEVLWIGTPKGLNRMSLLDQEISFHQFHSDDGVNIKANSIITLHETQNNMLWVGTEGGLICYEYKKNFYRIFKHDFNDPSSISHDFIRTIFQSGDGTIWIGTSRGLNRWNSEKMNFQNYTTANGLSNDMIYSIEEDDNGYLWLSTNNGIEKFDPQMSTFSNFCFEDGLQSNEFNTNSSYKDRDGILYFGGIHGYNRFSPDDIKINEYPPQVYINAVTTMSQAGDVKGSFKVSNIDKLVLSSIKDFSITIDFDAINFSNPQDNRYRYMLEGFDYQWREIGGNRKVMYTNLPSGNYKFKVAVTNNKKWIYTPATLNIQVVPAWWKTRLFFLCTFLLLVVLVFLFIRIRVRQIDLKNQELENVIRNRTQDLIDQKKLLKESENLFRNFYENSPIGIAYFTGLYSGMSKCNKRLCEMLGYSEEELCKKSIHKLTPIEDIPKDTIEFNEAIASKSEFWYKTSKRLVRKDKSIIYVSASLAFNWNASGNLNYMIIMFKDMTDEKAAQYRLEHTQTQLLHTDKMASLGQLTAGIAHEINNPVNFIYSGINGLKKNIKVLLEVMDKYDRIRSKAEFAAAKIEINQFKEVIDYNEVRTDINELTQAIEDGAFRTADIVQSLQTFSREDKNERQLANIHEGLDSTIQILRKQISGNITLTKYFDKNLPLIDCFPGRLNQVFLNILLNAIHAIDNKPGGIIIVKTKYYKQKKIVRIRFENNGVAIPEEILERIFEPFFTTKEVGKGTGLGLSISYGIIKDHQGKIWVENNKPHFTTFCIEIPLMD